LKWGFRLRGNPEQQIDPGAVPYWRWSAVISTGFLLLIPAGCYWAQHIWHWPAWIALTLLGLILAHAVYAIIFKPDIL
jgi:membrane protein YdbS with pleckstrin-like domain